MNVLLLEPDPKHGAAQEAALEHAGHRVACAATIHEALDRIRSFSPDLLVMELILEDQTALPVADYAAFACPDAEIVFIVRSGLFAHGELYQMTPNLAWIQRDPCDTCALVDLADHAEQCPRHAAKPSGSPIEPARRAVAAR